jgi:uncharacterized protein (DUF1810 family)
VSAGDPFTLRRFVEAQANGVYQEALAELRDGLKRSHWMWFVFPQHADLGRSSTAKYYGLSGVEEARAYLDHALLGPRLIECCEAIRPHLERGVRAGQILGPVDALKLKSSMEIFAAAGPGQPCFGELLALLA